MGPGAHHGTVRGLRANGPQWRIARRTKSRSTSPDHAVCGGLAIALLRNGFGLRRMSVQMAEVVISRQMFADVLSLIARLRAPPPVRAQCTDSFRHAGQPAEHLPYVCLNLDGKIITAGDGEEPARHAPGRRCPSSPAVPVSARSGSNANRFNQGTGGGNRVSGSSPTLFSARVMSSCTVSKFKSAVFSIMAETMAPPASSAVKKGTRYRCQSSRWGSAGGSRIRTFGSARIGFGFRDLALRPRIPKPSGGRRPCVPLLPLPSWTISRSTRKSRDPRRILGLVRDRAGRCSTRGNAEINRLEENRRCGRTLRAAPPGC